MCSRQRCRGRAHSPTSRRAVQMPSAPAKNHSNISVLETLRHHLHSHAPPTAAPTLGVHALSCAPLVAPHHDHNAETKLKAFKPCAPLPTPKIEIPNPTRHAHSKQRYAERATLHLNQCGSRAPARHRRTQTCIDTGAGTGTCTCTCICTCQGISIYPRTHNIHTWRSADILDSVDRDTGTRADIYPRTHYKNLAQRLHVGLL
jgi:hypothetical protein